MKKHLLLLLLFLPVMILPGQTITLQLGPSFSELKWENSLVKDEMFDKNVTGLNVLLGIDYLDLKYFNLTSGLGFIQKGGKDSMLVTNVMGEDGAMTLFRIRLDYLTINTAAVFKVPVKDFIFPYILIGPRFDYLISYNEDNNIIKQFDDSNHLNRFSYGFITSAGIRFAVKKIQLGIVFNYYLNLNKIVDYTSDKNVTNTLIDHTWNLDFQLGYKF